MIVDRVIGPTPLLFSRRELLLMEPQNVGRVDGIMRVALGVTCLALVGYHFLGQRILPLYLLIPVIVLIPFFLKTGITRVCPVMRAMGISSNAVH